MPVPKLPLKLVGQLERYHLHWWSLQLRKRTILTEWNRRHEAIFVHIPKTAGTSMLDALGAEAVFDTHAPALTYREADPELFARAYKFCVIRNPWDRFASSFHFMKSGTDWPMQQDWAQRHIGQLDFAGFVRKLRNPLFRQMVMAERFFWPQSFWLKDRQGRLIVDALFRFEELDEAIGQICVRLGIAAPERLPRHRQSGRASYHALYHDDEMIQIVGRLYAEDVARFGYSFAAADAPVPAAA